jgi:hypothetical protein
VEATFDIAAPPIEPVARVAGRDRFICFALELLRVSGAGKRNAEQLTRELHALGVSVTTSCSRLESSITVSASTPTSTRRWRCVDRIPPRAIADAVYRWLDEGLEADPRPARLAAAQKVDRAALEQWIRGVLAGPVILSVTGDHGKLDDARLGKLAPVTLVPVAKLFGY